MWQVCLSSVQTGCKLVFWKGEAWCPVMYLLCLPNCFVKINLQCLGKFILCDRFCPESSSLWRRKYQLTLRVDSDLSLPFDDFHAVRTLDIFPVGLNCKACSSWSWVGWGFHFAELKHSIMSLTRTAADLVSQAAFFFFSLHLPPPSLFPLDLLGNLKKSRVADTDKTRLMTGRGLLSQNADSSALR